ncbi:hypothetical protein BC937DRAFT_87801, partial [Endogone sp. FLAS-F59071]
IPRPTNASSSLDTILPLREILKSGQPAVLRRLDVSSAPESLLAHMNEIFNGVIEEGSTYPQEFALSGEQFHDYFLGYDAFLLFKDDGIPESADWRDKICNAGFVSSPLCRNQGVGRIMAKAFLRLAPALGYKSSVFNLVYESNAPSCRLWRSLGFKEVERIPGAGR